MDGINGLVEQLVLQALLDYEGGDDEAVAFLVQTGILGPDGFNLTAFERIQAHSA